ncbi:hypothetical protein DLAC_11559 [Tieghemostelium lacteum]|uniref:Uncharacterized protein n=1 Tax=Tieghemostelium lacteum TaxID=361077 RepID=A0A152A0G1_TIELA|nr:hypothetical protein DLAC_11559 [Tieghemostelium lacteum]|eukprot:KYQ99715.1 hypothetical protein DLAC_11559 [Tieghemostelium lacteum]
MNYHSNHGIPIPNEFYHMINKNHNTIITHPFFLRDHPSYRNPTYPYDNNEFNHLNQYYQYYPQQYPQQYEQNEEIGEEEEEEEYYQDDEYYEDEEEEEVENVQYVLSDEFLEMFAKTELKRREGLMKKLDDRKLKGADQFNPTQLSPFERETYNK